MTIKQLGGVFGRNPTFNDVTIEGQLTFDGDIDINSDLKVNGDLDVTGEGLFDGNIGINTDSPSSPTGKCLTVYDTSFPRINLKNSTTGDGATDGMEFYLNGANAYIVNRETGSIGFGTGNVVHMTLNTTGNLAFASGKGIDFSATAGTGTSELLDDYEEGTWSPAPEGETTPGTSTIVSSTAYYTKVGRCVFFDMTLQATGFNGTGNFLIAGLPFAAIGTGVCSVVANNTPWQTLSADNQNVSALPSGSYIAFRTLNRNQSGAYSIPQCAPTSTGYLRISGTYHTA